MGCGASKTGGTAKVGDSTSPDVTDQSTGVVPHSSQQSATQPQTKLLDDSATTAAASPADSPQTLSAGHFASDPVVPLHSSPTSPNNQNRASVTLNGQSPNTTAPPSVLTLPPGIPSDRPRRPSIRAPGAVPRDIQKQPGLSSGRNSYKHNKQNETLINPNNENDQKIGASFEHVNETDSHRKRKKLVRRTSHRGMLSRLALQFPLIRHSFLKVYDSFIQFNEDRVQNLPSVSQNYNITSLPQAPSFTESQPPNQTLPQSSTPHQTNHTAIHSVSTQPPLINFIPKPGSSSQLTSVHIPPSTPVNLENQPTNSSLATQTTTSSAQAASNTSAHPSTATTVQNPHNNLAAPLSSGLFAPSPSNGGSVDSFRRGPSKQMMKQEISLNKLGLLLNQLSYGHKVFTEEEVKELFKISDLDSSKTISFREFLIAAAIGYFLKDPASFETAATSEFLEIQRGFRAVEKAFKEMDVDHSNSVDVNELKKALFATTNERKSHKTKADEHSENEIAHSDQLPSHTSNPSMAANPPSEADILELRFKELDFDGDGDIYFPEFLYGFVAWVGFDEDDS